MANLEGLKLDAEEIRNFVSTSARPRVKEVLQRELIAVEQDISLLVHHTPSNPDEKLTESIPEVKKTKPVLFTTTITSYAWDQSDKFVKIYITLPGVEKISKGKIASKFTKNSMDVIVQELDGKNYQLKIKRLCHNILSEESFLKAKTNNLVIMMKKENAKEKWEDVSARVKDIPRKDKMNDAGDSTKDPQAAMMDLMKKMYEEGDEEMKRTITKAMVESREKVAGGQGLDMV